MSLLGHSGQTISSQTLGGFLVTEIAYSAGTSLSAHYHQHASFCFVLQGSYREVYREKVIRCDPSYLLYRPAGEAHSDHFGDTNVRCLLVDFEPKWLETFSRKPVSLNEPVGYQRHSLTWLARRLLNESHNVDDFTSLTVEALMLEIMVEIGRAKIGVREARPPRWLEQAKEILHTDFSEKLSLAKIAESVGVHPVYLANSFKQQYRCTIGDYLRRLRIEFASREISRGGDSLCNIALASGFSHQAHFSRTFKRLTGLTPSEFRASH